MSTWMIARRVAMACWHVARFWMFRRPRIRTNWRLFFDICWMYWMLAGYRVRQMPVNRAAVAGSGR